MSGDLSEGVLELVIGLTVVKDEVSRADNSAIERLVGEPVLQEVLHLADHVVAHLRLDIPLAKGVRDLAEPGLTTDIFGVKSLICHDVQWCPPPVVQVTEPLMMHSHVNKHHRGQVASSC